MNVVRLIASLFLLAWPAWALTCPDNTQVGETLELELVEVTVDGQPLQELGNYADYRIEISNQVDTGEWDGATLTVTFEATRQRFTQGARMQREVLQETYPVVDRSIVGE